VLLNLLNLCTLPFRPRQDASSWANPFNLTEQPSEATLTLITNNISASHPLVQSIVLTILPPVYFRSVSIPLEGQGFLQRSELVVGSFLEGWTRRVGDPVISKWIVVILCVSMGLNAWLLNAASRGAMQPLQVSSKSTISDKLMEKVRRTSISQPSISTTSEKPAVKSTTSFAMNDCESDDEEKRLSGIKKNSRRVRSVSECMQILTDGRPQDLFDEEVIALTIQKKIPLYALEKTLKDLERAVKIRRATVCMPPYF
jgi:hydroxymethylglutaryl-CoA reductase (NADPH)